MAPRIPLTAEQSGRGQIGNIGVTTNVSTPFQSFTVPLFNEGAKTTATLAKGAFAASDAVKDFVMAESKRDLSRYDAAATVLRSQYEEQIKAAEGQERLDLIRGTSIPGTPGFTTLPLQDQYTAALEKLKKQFANKFTPDDELAVDMFSLKSRQSFQVFQNDHGNDAQDAVDAQMMTAKIATATKIAVDSLSLPITEGVGGKLSGPGAKRRNEAFNSAATAVTDPHLGQAAKLGITDKTVIEGLVQKQQGLVVTEMVNALMAEGKEAEAMALIDYETGPHGHITDEVVTSQLQARVLPYQEDINAQANFEALVERTPDGPRGTPSLYELTKAIAAEPDRRIRAGLERQYGKYKAVITAERIEKVATEMHAAIKHVVEGKGRITLQMIPNIWLDNPELAKQLTEGGGFANPQTGVDASDQGAWEAQDSGGGRTFNRTVDIMMVNLQKSNPSEWLSVVRKGHLKGLINLKQDRSYRKEIAVTQKIVDDARSEDRVNLDQILKDIGVTQKVSRTRTITMFNDSLSAAVNRIRTPAIDAGQKPDYNELKAAVAQALIKVRTEDNFFLADVYHHTASTQVAASGGKPFEMRLDFTQQNVNYIASALGVDTPRITEAMDGLPDSKHTLTDVAKKIKVALPTDPNSQVAQYDNTLHTLSVEQGLPSGFIEFLLFSAKRTDGSRYKMTAEDLVAVTKDWEKRLPRGHTKETAMQEWLSR